MGMKMGMRAASLQDREPDDGISRGGGGMTQPGVSAEEAADNLRRMMHERTIREPVPPMDETVSLDFWLRVRYWLRGISTKQAIVEEYGAGYRSAAAFLLQYGMDSVIPTVGQSVPYIVGGSRARRDLTAMRESWILRSTQQLRTELREVRAQLRAAQSTLHAQSLTLSDEDVAELRERLGRAVGKNPDTIQPEQAAAPQRRMFRSRGG